MGEDCEKLKTQQHPKEVSGSSSTDCELREGSGVRRNQRKKNSKRKITWLPKYWHRSLNKRSPAREKEVRRNSGPVLLENLGGGPEKTQTLGKVTKEKKPSWWGGGEVWNMVSSGVN